MSRRTICGKPLSQLCAFSTPVFIKIKDERLGVLHWGLLGALLGYVFLYQILYGGQHLKTETPIGSVSFQLKRPTIMSDMDYWNASDPDRTNTASNFPTALQLRYCKNSTVGPQPLSQRACRYLDEEDIALLTPGVCVISTRVSTMVQKLNCATVGLNESCSNLYNVSKSDTDSYFVVQPEDFTIMFDHEVFTPSTAVYAKANAPDSVSKLAMPDGTELSPTDGSPFQRLLNRDTMTVRQLLAAAGVTDLDAPMTGLFDSGSTMRNTGITILLKIKYENYKHWGFVQGPVMYTYEVSQGAVYEAHHKTYMLDPQTRMFENRHGITINVAQIGKLSSFDMLSLTVFFASALALMTVTNIVVDMLALWFLKESKTYEKAKYMTTDNRTDIAEFLEYRKAQGLPEIENYDEFREELRLFLESRAKDTTPLVGYSH